VSSYYPHFSWVVVGEPVVPAVSKIELSPFIHPRAVTEFCQQRHCRRAPARWRWGAPAGSDLVAKHKYGKTSAQIMLRWSLQHGYVVIPQSARPERIEENADVFDFVLAPEDMVTLDTLHDSFRATGLDPSQLP
jgi:diketogulonate reductase-like aldo/keto reductase